MTCLFKIKAILLISLLCLGQLLLAQNPCKAIRIEIDKNLYISGEKINFRVLPQNENDLTSIRKTLYVDLCGENQIINTIIVERKNNFWNDDISIPDSLGTGVYVLRAHTGRLDRNFALGILPVTVINRFGKNDQNQAKKQQNCSPFNCFSPYDAAAEIWTSLGLQSEYKVQSSVKIPLNIDPRKWKNVSVSVARVPDSQEQTINPAEQFDIEMDLQNFNIPQKSEYPEGIVISGKILDEANNPVANETVLLSFLDSIPQIAYSYSQADGHFVFVIDDCYGKKEAVIQTLEKGKPRAVLLDSQNFPAPSRIPYFVPEYIEKNDFVSQSIDRFVVQKAYGSIPIDSIPPRQNHIAFYGVPYNIVYPDRFIELEDFVDISREILFLSRLRFENKQPKLRIYDPNMMIHFDNPWILVDGVPLFDVNSILKYNSNAIQRIETQPQFRSYGNLYFQGLLSIVTKKQSLKTIKIPINAIKAEIIGFKSLQKPVPNFDIKGTEPNFEDVLYWNPNFNLDDEALQFETSMEIGTYKMIIRADEGNGNWRESSKCFSVVAR